METVEETAGQCVTIMPDKSPRPYSAAWRREREREEEEEERKETDRQTEEEEEKRKETDREKKTETERKREREKRKRARERERTEGNTERDRDTERNRERERERERDRGERDTHTHRNREREREKGKQREREERETETERHRDREATRSLPHLKNTLAAAYPQIFLPDRATTVSFSPSAEVGQGLDEQFSADRQYKFDFIRLILALRETVLRRPAKDYEELGLAASPLARSPRPVLAFVSCLHRFPRVHQRRPRAAEAEG